MIRTIILILFINFFAINANATSTREIINNTPALLLFVAMQAPNIIARAIGDN